MHAAKMQKTCPFTARAVGPIAEVAVPRAVNAVRFLERASIRSGQIEFPRHVRPPYFLFLDLQR